MFGLFKRVRELDRLLAELEQNMQNNYKDAAQKNAKELAECYERLLQEEKLSKKQQDIYRPKINGYLCNMKGYSHKDQKPYW